MAKRGRKSKYNPDIHPHFARWLIRDGYTHEQIADDKAFDISRKTLYEWQKKYPEFRDALNSQGKEAVDNGVEDSLYKTATGFHYTETRTIYRFKKDGTRHKFSEEETKKYNPPNVRACIRWLMNRKPDEWREKGTDLKDDEVKGVLRLIAATYREDQAG